MSLPLLSDDHTLESTPQAPLNRSEQLFITSMLATGIPCWVMTLLASREHQVLFNSLHRRGFFRLSPDHRTYYVSDAGQVALHEALQIGRRK